MKYLVSSIFTLCFVASMTGCSRGDNFEITKTGSSSELAVTELESSSNFSSTVNSSTVEDTETILKTTNATTTIATVDTDSTEEITSKVTETTTVPSTKGQAIETTVEEIVVKPIETITTTTDYIENPVTSANETYSIGIDSYSYQLLAEIVEHEAGIESINIYDKAHIAAAVMNRVYDDRFPNTVYNNLIDQTQFPGYWPGCITPRATAYEAVDYYLANPYEFDNSNSWFGDGVQNYFYYQ